MAGKDDELEKTSSQTEGTAVDNPEADPIPPQSEWGVELGVEHNLPFTTPFVDPMGKRAREAQELRELLRGTGEEFGPTVAQLVAMRRLDGQARALYRLLTLPIRAALRQATFVPAEGGEAEAEFIDQMFNLPPNSGGMSVPFSMVMSQLLQGLFDGFAPFEQVYDQAKYGPLKGKYVLKKLAYRQPDTISVVEDDDGHFKGFRQRAQRGDKIIDVYIPRDRCFYYAAQEEERKYYGVSFFQSAFYHYDKKIKTYYIAHLAAQRSAVGTRVGTHPLSATQIQRSTLAQNLSNLALAQWMMVPEGTKVEVLKDSGNFDFLAYINHHDNQMSKSILANFFDSDTGSGKSDASMVNFGQPGDDMFILMLRAIMDDIAQKINFYIIPRIIDWNFKGGKYPTFQWAELTDDQKAMITSTFDKLSTAGEGINVSQEFMRELEKKMSDEMGLELDWEAIEEREAAEKATNDLMQGIGPDGKPLPKDAMGNPIQPGQADPEAALKAFEELNGGGGNTAAASDDPEDKKKVKLSAGTDVDLLKMANDLMDKASLELAAGDRVVRTQEGSRLYGKPIGAKILGSDVANDNTGERQTTIERLMNLRDQVEGFLRAGNLAEAKKTQTKLRQEVAEYAGSTSAASYFEVMKKLKSASE